MKVELTLEKYEEMRDQINRLQDIIDKLTKGQPDICVERNLFHDRYTRLINSTGLIERLKQEAESQKYRADSIMNSKLPFFCIGGRRVKDVLK